MTALDLVIRHGIDPVFLLCLLWLVCTLTAPMIGARK